MPDTITREFIYEDGLTLKQRNARRKQLEADGWTVKSHGSNRGGWTVSAHRGEAPYMIRQTFDLRHGGHTVTPMYRRKDGNGSEYMDGTPEHPDE